MPASLEPMSNGDRYLLLSMALCAVTVSVIGILSISNSDCDKLIKGGYAAYLILQGQLMFGQKLHAFIYKVPMEPSKQVRAVILSSLEIYHLLTLPYHCFLAQRRTRKTSGAKRTPKLVLPTFSVHAGALASSSRRWASPTSLTCR